MAKPIALMIGICILSLASTAAPAQIPASVAIEVDARLGAEDLMELALEQFQTVFTSISADERARPDADLIGRFELWRYGNVPGAGWTCIADIALELYTPDGELIFREVGRGCGATKLRKGLFEAALADLAQQVLEAPAVREFVETGVTTSPPSSVRPPTQDDSFEVATIENHARVSWQVALDPTQSRHATVIISDTRRRSQGIRQINIRGDSIETIDNPAGLPLGYPVSLSGSLDDGLKARVELEEFRFDGAAWQPVDGFAPCFSDSQIDHAGYCGIVVRGGVVDSPRRWRVDVIGGSGISAPAILPLPMLYRAPKLVVASAPLEDSPFYVVLDRESTVDFSPSFGVLGVQSGWQYVPWEIQLDAAGTAHVLTRTSKPQELRYARIPFPELAGRIESAGPLTNANEDEDDLSLAKQIESSLTVDVGTISVGESCTTCSQALAVDPDTGTAMILSREKRETWNTTFISPDGQTRTTALPDMVWPLKVLAGRDERFYVLGFLPLALANVPGRLGIYSISPDEPIRHEVTLTTSSWALLPPVGFERDPNTGSILTVWHSDRDTLHAAWYDPS